MHPDLLEYRRNHGSPERLPGTYFREVAASALKKGFFRSKEVLALELARELQFAGITYHVRTMKRQISGFIASVPPEAEAAMKQLLSNGHGRGRSRPSRALQNKVGVRWDGGRMAPPYILSEKVLPLVHLWLHLNPGASKRALAMRLQSDLKDQRISYTVDSLQAILAGKNRLVVRRAIEEKLLEYLWEAGVRSRGEAEARARAEAVQRSLAGREFVPGRQFRELCLLWFLRHGGATARQLSVLLRRELLERGVSMHLDQVQRTVAGRTRKVRRFMEATLEKLLKQDFPEYPDLDEALSKTSADRQRKKRDLDWVPTGPIVELARKWVQKHPDTSMRQLAIRVSSTLKRLGYSRCHEGIQPVLTGWKKKTRQFVYRAVLLECGQLGTRCATKGCVFPAVRDGLCRMCWLLTREPQHFVRYTPSTFPCFPTLETST